MDLIGKNFIVDTNIPINYTGHILNLSKDKDNTCIIFPEIMLEEFDNVKRKANNKEHGVYEASAFIRLLTSNFKMEDIPLDFFDLKFSDSQSDVNARVIDFSNAINKEAARELAKDNPLFNEKLEGKLAFVPLSGLFQDSSFEKKYSKEALEEKVMSGLNFSVGLGINDNLLAGLSIRASKNSNKKTKFITLDNNLTAVINLNYDNIVEAPTGGLKLAGEKYQGYRILTWKDFFESKYVSEFRAEVMRMSDVHNPNGFKLDLDKVSKELVKMFYTQDYLIFVNHENDKKTFFKKVEDGSNDSIPQYFLPPLNNVARFVQTDKDSYFLHPLDNRVIASNHKPKYLQNFKIKSIESLLLMDAMFQDKNLYILHGEAGTGKTFSAMYFALGDILNRFKGDWKAKGNFRPKLMINKPLVGLGGGEFGYLPGDIYEKHGPFLDSLEVTFQFMKTEIGLDGNYSLKDMIVNKVKENHQDLIELKTSAHIRGLTIQPNQTFISDEFQNYAAKDGLELIPRLGAGKLILVGDPFQVDKFNMDKSYNAMREIMVRSRNILKCDDDGELRRDLDLQNRTTIIHFQNYLRSSIMEAIMNRYHGIKR